jgi:hypothetical protein
VFGLRGKNYLDKRLANYNRAAKHGAWLVVRDTDNDSGGCPVTLRSQLLQDVKNPALCSRLAVRSIDAWLMADGDAFAEEFAVSRARIPEHPEALDDPKRTLAQLCADSRKRAVREGMVPPKNSVGKVGPEYTSMIMQFCRGAWRPDVAAHNAPSLQRALRDIDRLVGSGLWT